MPLVSPVLIGRDDERRRLASAMTNASAGRGSVVVVSGPAGIGKSALARSTFG